jgi:hypothetical protein
MSACDVEYKVIKTLEFYLSLHEADEIFSMIFDDDVRMEQVEEKLKEFRDAHADRE